MLGLIKQMAVKASKDWQKRIVDDFLNWSDAPRVSEDEFKRRIAICEGCDRFDPEARKCKVCGCFMDAKASLEEYPVVILGRDKKVKCSDKTNPLW